MNYQVVRLLQPDEAAQLARCLESRQFDDGKRTAIGRAREAKHNLQIETSNSANPELAEPVIAAFGRSSEFQCFALPRRVMPPMFSRYEPGMRYGAHVDNAMMGGFGGLRTDLSVTLFLSPPATYDGGELVLEMPVGEQEIKLDAGEAVLYSSTFIHRVAPVTRGVRLAAVTWVQSAVRDENLRSILFDIHRALRKAEAAGDQEQCLLLTKSYHNLIRYAAES